jgi:uncharacterized membrane protein
LFLQIGIYLVASGVWKGLPGYWILVFIPIILGTTIWLYIKMDKAIKKQLLKPITEVAKES